MCEFHDCNCNGFGDMWWTDKCTYFSSIDYVAHAFVVFITINNEQLVVNAVPFC